MRLTANELAREAAATGFQAEPLEKVIILLELLEAIRSHPDGSPDDAVLADGRVEAPRVPEAFL